MPFEKCYISHLYQDRENCQWVVQTNDEHCEGVASLAEQFANQFGLGYYGYVLGMLHDKGKERDAFQQYIRETNGLPLTDRKQYGEYHHAFVGGILATNIMGKGVLNLLANQIISHHTGLHDYADAESILEERKLPAEINTKNIGVDKSLLLKELTESSFSKSKVDTKHFHHLSRMLFSCLVDADRLDTERFMNVASWKKRSCPFTISDLLPKLEVYLQQLASSAHDTEVNRIRKQVQEQCRITSSCEKGFYSLTVPTGGGKTLSSLLWAMKHAVNHGMNRIIIAIPYTSIIIQTAGLLKKIFGEENVLEHHSNFNPDEIKNEEVREKAKLATENWDYPIIVTTNVQLFESMFSNKPSECRKLHNIVNAVLILDEVQTLPTDFLQPIVDALKAYQQMFGVSVLFTTASQPLLNGLIEGCNPKTTFHGIDNITEIIPQKYALHDRLRRVKLEIDDTGSTYDEIAERLSIHNKVLCIVNTRNDAREIYERLPKDGITIHLSRMMCPRHISRAIKKIRMALSDDSEGIIRVIATQLIEAGVDIDFPVVYRQEAGLDSVLQAAGRCNREGKLNIATTYVFSLSKEHILHGNIKDANNARLNVANVNDWFAPETMTDYFRQLYSRKETFDKKDIKFLLYKPTEMCFAEAAKEFGLIEEVGKTVIVNMDDSLELVERVKTDGITYSLMKQLSQYSVNIYERDFNKLLNYGAVEEVVEGIYVVNDKAQYDENIGLRLDNHWMNEILLK